MRQVGARFGLALVIVLCALAQSQRAQAQESTFQEWLSLPFTYDVGDADLRPQLWMDLHARRRSGSTLFILRPAIGLRVSSIVAAHVGYAWIPTVALIAWLLS